MEIDDGIDILKPTTKLVNGSVYRILCPPRNSDIHVTYTSSPGIPCKASVYDDEPITCSTKDENVEWQTCNIRSPFYFHRHIVGRNGATKKRLENETGTFLTVPKPSEKNDCITVKYRSEASLSSIETRITSIVENARKKERPTHFLSIPVHGEKIKQNLSKFEQLCIEKLGLSENIIQSYVKLHMTVGAIKLFSDAEIEQAKRALNEFSAQIPYLTCGKPLRGLIKGLEIMNDEPANTRVLYGEMRLQDDSDRLQNLVDKCLEFFVDRKLMSYDYHRQNVKLHCTLINVRWGNLNAIDVTPLLGSDWELQELGECVLDKLELNEMKTDEITRQYINVSSVSLLPR